MPQVSDQTGRDASNIPRRQSASLPLSTLTATATTTPTGIAMVTWPERCPICFANPLQEPFATRCGHVFCYECLRTHLDEHRFCPQCREFTTPESIVPAFLANNTAGNPQMPSAINVTANSPSTAINNVARGMSTTPPLAGSTTPNLVGPADGDAPTPRTPQHLPIGPVAIPRTPRTPHITTTVGTSASTPRTPRNPTSTIPTPYRTHTPITDNSDRPRNRTPSTAAESPAPGLARAGRHDEDDDVTPDLTDALSSRRRSPPRIHRNLATARSDKSPASRRRARAAMVAVGAELSSAPSVNNDVSAPGTGQGPTTNNPNPTNTAVAGPSGSNLVKRRGTPVLNTSVAALLDDDNADPDQIAAIIEMLQKKRNDQNTVQKHMRSALLHDFLFKARTERLEDIGRLKAQVGVLDMDLKAISNHSKYIQKVYENPAWNGKRRRVNKNYEPLKESYFSSVATTPSGTERKKALNRFTDDIMKVTQYSRFRCRASLLHVARHSGSTSNIVSSIEFDRESRLLATAGVTKRIKLFEFPTVDDDSVRLGEHHYPVKEVVARAKLSWVCWNPYVRQQLVSSDYDGIVTLWDINRGVAINEYEEHDKRVWSVDFCTADPRVFASGSDDGKVKIWTTAQSNSAVTIGKGCANVCSVKFQPDSMYTLAFGSADHHVHYYDIRYHDTPLQVFEGHQRTVSYVKFMSPREMVSACVDSTIKLWALDTMELKRTYTGHVNDKNFVGLSVTDEYLACGSEQNTIFAYYKSVPRPFAKYRFPESDLVTGAETQEDDESFVSSVCWCPKNPKLLVGANSVGIIKVLQLAEDDDGDEDDEKSDQNSSSLDN